MGGFLFGNIQSLKLTAEAEVLTRYAQENEFLSAYTPPCKCRWRPTAK
jgi:hypothetical protein